MTTQAKRFRLLVIDAPTGAPCPGLWLKSDGYLTTQEPRAQRFTFPQAMRVAELLSDADNRFLPELVSP